MVLRENAYFTWGTYRSVSRVTELTCSGKKPTGRPFFLAFDPGSVSIFPLTVNLLHLGESLQN